MRQRLLIQNQTITNLLSGKMGKKYEGKQVVIVSGKVYILPDNDQKSAEFLNALVKKNPKATPTVAFVPKKGSYILVLQF